MRLIEQFCRGERAREYMGIFYSNTPLYVQFSSARATIDSNVYVNVHTRLKHSLPFASGKLAELTNESLEVAWKQL